MGSISKWMRVNRTKYTYEEISEAVANAESYSDIFRNLGLKINGGSYTWLKGLVKRHNLNIGHFITKKERLARLAKTSAVLLAEDLYGKEDISNGERMGSRRLRNFILFNKVEYRCSKCYINTWNGFPIQLDIDHIDGNCINNSLKNLQFICPNCHRQKTITIDQIPIYPVSLTEKNEIKHKNIKRKDKSIIVGYIRKSYECATCQTKVSNESTHCRSCAKKGKFNIIWPPESELQELVWNHTFTKLGEMFQASDVAVKKHCQRSGIAVPTQRYRRLYYNGKFDECLNLKQELMNGAPTRA